MKERRRRNKEKKLLVEAATTTSSSSRSSSAAVDVGVGVVHNHDNHHDTVHRLPPPISESKKRHLEEEDIVDTTAQETTTATTLPPEDDSKTATTTAATTSSGPPTTLQRPHQQQPPPPQRLTTKMMDGVLYVLQPSELCPKDAKKFRKDARRKLRVPKHGSTQQEFMETLEFVTAKEMPSMASSVDRTRRLATATAAAGTASTATATAGNKRTKLTKYGTKEFPSIQELLQEKRALEERQKEDQRRHDKLHAVPETVKSRYIAMDCEMVGIGTDGTRSALARVSLVDWNLRVVLDTFVQVPMRVTDFRTHVSGVTPKHIQSRTGAMDVVKCRQLVADMLKDKVLVGHALSNDLKALLLTHPKTQIRDTAKYRPYQRYRNGKWRPRKLRDLVHENLRHREEFQQGEHDSTEDAKATMELFQLVYNQWEKDLANK